MTRTLGAVLIVVWASLGPLGATPAPAIAQVTDAGADSADSTALPPAWLAFKRTWSGVSAFRATVAVFDQRGTSVQNMLLDYTFRKPSSATIHVVKGPNAGGTLVWSGGNAVVARRGSGLLRLFTKTYALHDPAVTTLDGSSIDQLSFAAILSHAQGTPGIASEAVGPTIDGVSTKAVMLVPTSPATDAGLTLEVVDISSTTNLPVRVLGYEGPVLVRTAQFSNVKVQL